jgi:hypothetical protein
MNDPEPFLETAGAAVRSLPLDRPTSIDTLRLRARKRRHRRRTVTIVSGAAVTAALAIVVVFVAVSIQPGGHRVITTSPGPAQTTPKAKAVYPPAVGHPNTWTALDIGRLRLFVPPRWQTNAGPPDCNDGDGDLVTLAYSKPPRSCTSNPSAYLTVRTGPIHTPTGRRSQRHGLTIWTSHPDTDTTVITVPALRSTLTAHGSEPLTVARTLGPSSLQVVLTMTGPIPVPSTWKPVRYHDVQVDVPAGWKVATVPYDCGTLFMNGPTAYTGPPAKSPGAPSSSATSYTDPTTASGSNPHPAPSAHQADIRSPTTTSRSTLNPASTATAECRTSPSPSSPSTPQPPPSSPPSGSAPTPSPPNESSAPSNPSTTTETLAPIAPPPKSGQASSPAICSAPVGSQRRSILRSTHPPPRPADPQFLARVCGTSAMWPQSGASPRRAAT